MSNQPAPSINILPPHLGDPRQRADLAPFSCTVAELCERFATSRKRKEILNGFLNLRAELLVLRIRGFQWLDGSFLEDIEAQEGRDPGDIDAITFVADPETPANLRAKLATKPELLGHGHVKGTYSVDHYWVSLGSKPAFLVDQTRYWYGLFSHRPDGVWKGILRAERIGTNPKRQRGRAKPSLTLRVSVKPTRAKYMLVVDLVDKSEDDAARVALGGQP